VNALRRVGHLARRWRTSLDRSSLSAADDDFVRRVLTAGEYDLWSNMTLADRRHSIVVARRFVNFAPDADEAEIAAALLHDVGKTQAPLATTERIFATVLGSVLRLRRWDAYRRHEEIGLELCRRLPSRPRTLALLAGEDGPLIDALRRADDV
jgi:hypothetical protein